MTAVLPTAETFAAGATRGVVERSVAVEPNVPPGAGDKGDQGQDGGREVCEGWLVVRKRFCREVNMTIIYCCCKSGSRG